MSDPTGYHTITDTYLAALTGDYSGSLPTPVTQTHILLAKLCERGIGGGGGSTDLTEIKAQIAALQTAVSGLESDMGDVKTALESIVEVSE